MEMVDKTDSKSVGALLRVGSSPTGPIKIWLLLGDFIMKSKLASVLIVVFFYLLVGGFIAMIELQYK